MELERCSFQRDNMKTLLIFLGVLTLDVNSDINLLVEALIKNYQFKEIVYENNKAIQESAGTIIRADKTLIVSISSPFRETYKVDANKIEHIDHDLDQTQLIPIKSINSSLLNVFLKVDYEELRELNIDMVDNMFTLNEENQRVEFFLQNNSLKKINYFDNLDYRHEVILTLYE